MDRQFDYIVVGAGSAGCVVAARLSEDPNIDVLVVEAGGSDRHLTITMPGALPFVYQSKRIGWGYQSGPEPELLGRTIDEKAGKVLGGSSSINAMIFNRGNPMDYDGWAADGLSEWDFAHCLPYFRKMESFADGPDEWRGGDGPLKISRARADHKLYEAFMHAGAEAGHEVTADHNGYRQEGMHIAQSFIHAGVRWSATRAYLRPAADRPNLHVLKRTTVRRVLFDDGSAIGVEVSRRGSTQRITCSREVIVCAGAVNTPKLLMLSGVGDPDELRRHGIGVVACARQVGRNLQNHPGLDIQFATADEDSLTSQLHLGGRAKLSAEWLLRRRGLGAANFFEAGAFLRGRDNVSFPNLQYEFLPLTRKLVNGRLVPVPGFQVWVDLSRPESRGSVTLRSADPDAAPLTVFNHFQCRQDMVDMIAAVRQTRDIAAQPSLARYSKGELSPGPDVVSDKDIEALIRKGTGTSYHPSGTCRMGVDDDAVVDAEGRVKTVSRLRVVDASIMPRVVTGNLNAPVMMMAEKIADNIKGVVPLPVSHAGYFKSVT
jgi:choline dehydrogenase